MLLRVGRHQRSSESQDKTPEHITAKKKGAAPYLKMIQAGYHSALALQFWLLNPFVTDKQAAGEQVGGGWGFGAKKQKRAKK